MGAVVERLLRGKLGGLGGAAIVLHQKLDVRIVEFGDRHFRGIAHRLAGNAGIAGRRQRQDQPHFDLAGADGRARRHLRTLRRRVVDIYCELLEQPANNAPAVASKPTIERRRVGIAANS